jgi:type III restriction enzyme
VKNKTFYYQCVFEVKGSHLLEKDKWKELALSELSKSEILLTNHKESNDFILQIKNSNYTNIKNLGFYFYNTENEEQELKFKNQFSQILIK